MKFNLEVVPNPVGMYVKADDYDSLMDDVIELEAALRNVHKLICEGAEEGFNCHIGDWAERLFRSNQKTSEALGRL